MLQKEKDKKGGEEPRSPTATAMVKRNSLMTILASDDLNYAKCACEIAKKSETMHTLRDAADLSSSGSDSDDLVDDLLGVPKAMSMVKRVSAP